MQFRLKRLHDFFRFGPSSQLTASQLLMVGVASLAVAVMAKPEVVQGIVDLGHESIQGDSPAKFEAYYKNDFAKWEKLVAAVGVKLDCGVVLDVAGRTTYAPKVGRHRSQLTQ